jgi:hypothetical protein
MEKQKLAEPEHRPEADGAGAGAKERGYTGGNPAASDLPKPALE